jgi:hypothetical protein
MAEPGVQALFVGKPALAFETFKHATLRAWESVQSGRTRDCSGCDAVRDALAAALAPFGAAARLALAATAQPERIVQVVDAERMRSAIAKYWERQ